MSDELTPITRKETFLAKAGGQNVVTPTPITREETFLQAIIDNGSGGGGGGGGALIVHLDMQSAALDKTWAEINAADLAFVSMNQGGMKLQGYVAITTLSESGYEVGAISCGNISEGVVVLGFVAESADGYPVLSM